MIALVGIVVDEGFNLRFEIGGQEVVFEQNAVHQSLMPAFDLALGLRMIRRTTRMLHAFVLQPFCKIARDVTGSVVAEQTWLVNDVNLIAARCLQRQVLRVGHIFSRMVVQSFRETM